MHLSEEEMIELFYGDAAPSSRRHLTECSTCRERSAEISQFLTSVPDDAPEPDESWESELWARLDRELPRRKSVVGFPRWLAAAAVLVIIAGGSLLMLPMLSDTGDREIPAVEESLSVDSADRERMLMFVILRHLDESERMVVELSNTEATAVGEVQRNLADELLERNRLYRKSAEIAGSNEAARLLDDLELILLETARGGSTPGSVELIRDLMNQGELLFKINVLRNGMEQGRWLAETPSV